MLSPPNSTQSGSSAASDVYNGQDVRTRGEYAQGHIPKSRNLPLQELHKAPSAIPGRDTPLFVYCLSGARSRQAVSQLQEMGYTDVTNLGGIQKYQGKVVR